MYLDAFKLMPLFRFLNVDLNHFFCLAEVCKREDIACKVTCRCFYVALSFLFCFVFLQDEQDKLQGNYCFHKRSDDLGWKFGSL